MFTFHVPTKVLFGAGVLKKLHEEMLPGKKALVVISNGKSTRTNGSLAALDFLGFGLPPMTPSCGELMQEVEAFEA